MDLSTYRANIAIMWKLVDKWFSYISAGFNSIEAKADRGSNTPSQAVPTLSQYEYCMQRKAPRESPQEPARTSAAGLNIPADHPRAARRKEEGFSSCTQGPRRRPKAMRAAKDPVW